MGIGDGGRAPEAAAKVLLLPRTAVQSWSCLVGLLTCGSILWVGLETWVQYLSLNYPASWVEPPQGAAGTVKQSQGYVWSNHRPFLCTAFLWAPELPHSGHGVPCGLSHTGHSERGEGGAYFWPCWGGEGSMNMSPGRSVSHHRIPFCTLQQAAGDGPSREPLPSVSWRCWESAGEGGVGVGTSGLWAPDPMDTQLRTSCGFLCLLGAPLAQSAGGAAEWVTIVPPQPGRGQRLGL